VITNYNLEHWDVWVDNYYQGQPYEQYASTCYSDDGKYGCTQ
jgi:hypothetical protein